MIHAESYMFVNFLTVETTQGQDCKYRCFDTRNSKKASSTISPIITTMERGIILDFPRYPLTQTKAKI